nr:hypothetical protein CFP56_20056 [Quercus suber]
MSKGRSGSGLCLTCNRPDQNEWGSSRPAADCEKPLVESDRAREAKTNLRDGGEEELGALQTKSEDRRQRAQINDEEVEIDDGKAEIDDEQDRQRVDIGEEQRS